MTQDTTMAYDSTNDLIDSNKNAERELNNKTQQQTKHDINVRKRIDDFIEQKRLKYLLDDSDDWTI